jgi:hypothetical protein
VSIARWSKEDPEAPSAAELVEQLHEAVYGGDRGQHPLPVNAALPLHWDRLLREVAEVTDAWDNHL